MLYNEGEQRPYMSPVMIEIDRRVKDPRFGSDGRLRVYGIYSPPSPYEMQRNSFVFLAPATSIRRISIEKLDAGAARLLEGISSSDHRRSHLSAAGLTLPLYYFQEELPETTTSISASFHPSSLSADIALRELTLFFAELDKAMSGESDGSFETYVDHRGVDRRDLAMGATIPHDWLENLQKGDPQPYKY